MRVGDSVTVGGGYDNRPGWLAANRDGYVGREAGLRVAQMRNYLSDKNRTRTDS